jgi:hypothetical protein
MPIFCKYVLHCIAVAKYKQDSGLRLVNNMTKNSNKSRSGYDEEVRNVFTLQGFEPSSR